MKNDTTNRIKELEERIYSEVDVLVKQTKVIADLVKERSGAKLIERLSLGFNAEKHSTNETLLQVKEATNALCFGEMLDSVMTYRHMLDIPNEELGRLLSELGEKPEVFLRKLMFEMLERKAGIYQKRGISDKFKLSDEIEDLLNSLNRE